MGSARILFVDDEESIRITLPPVLREKGFEVAVAGSVAEALAEINSEKFDVLIADLNLAEEGDGFLVVSAMRHIQPQCVNLILTGYPALETALQAIHSQVDDYLTKPADLDALISTINEKLRGRKSQPSVRLQRLSTLLNDHATDICEKILEAMKQDPQIMAIRLPDSELIGYVPSVLSALAQQLDSRQDTLNSQTILLVSEHGIRRKKKGYTLRMLIEEVHFLEQAVYDLVQKNWGTLDITILSSELNGFQNGLHAIRLRAVEPFAKGKKTLAKP